MLKTFGIMVAVLAFIGFMGCGGFGLLIGLAIGLFGTVLGLLVGIIGVLLPILIVIGLVFGLVKLVA